ncbi:MAG: hypothetical protein ACXW1S_01185 [Acidimicrobiia bacterium]
MRARPATSRPVRDLRPSAEIGEGLPEGAEWSRPGEIPDQRREIESSGCFDHASVHRFDREIVYGIDGYLELLDTFSGHRAMQQWQRDRLYDEIRRRLGRRPDGTVRRHWGAALHVARRRENPTGDPAPNLRSRDG